MFEPYLQRWQLTPDGAAIMTPGSQLLPVTHGRHACDVESLHGR